MDCCGHAHSGHHHHSMWSPVLASAGAMLAGEAGPRGSTAAAGNYLRIFRAAVG